MAGPGTPKVERRLNRPGGGRIRSSYVDDLRGGRPVELRPARWTADRRPSLSAEIIHHKERPLGIAAAWFLDRVS